MDRTEELGLSGPGKSPVGHLPRQICAALKKAKLLDQTPGGLWKNKWVVHCQLAGSGDKVLDYLGRYVFRIAISNSRIEQIDKGR